MSDEIVFEQKVVTMTTTSTRQTDNVKVGYNITSELKIKLKDDLIVLEYIVLAIRQSINTGATYYINWLIVRKNRS